MVNLATTAPVGVLDPAMLYLGDNGRCFCGRLGCAGQTAFFTGRALDGFPVVSLSEVARLDPAADDLARLACEGCGQKLCQECGGPMEKVTDGAIGEWVLTGCAAKLDAIRDLVADGQDVYWNPDTEEHGPADWTDDFLCYSFHGALVTCPNCRGSGKSFDGPCIECSGTGCVSREAAESMIAAGCGPWTAKQRKPLGVWMLLQDGAPWFYSRERNLDEAMKTARALRGSVRDNQPPGELFKRSPVWIAPPPVVGLRPELAKFRRGR